MIQLNLIGIGYSWNTTPLSELPVGEVTLSQVDPLSVDLTMVPELPTATKVLFPKVTLFNQFAVGEVALSQVDPLSVDLIMFPDQLTPTNTPEPDDDEEEEEELSEVLVELSEESSEDEVVLSVLAVLLSSDFAHEETSTAMMTIKTNQDKKLFILFLHRKCCKIKTTHLDVTSIGLFYKNEEELLGIPLTL